jgi:hypothetical protein
MYGIGYGYSSIGATTKSSGGGVAYDSDAQAFFTASGITDLTQKNAVNQLVLDLKSNSLWTKMKALYPIVGGNASAHSYNLVNTSLYQLSFSSGWTHSSNGMSANGNSAYADTGINPNVALTTMSSGLSVYNRTTGYVTGFDIGVIDSLNNNFYGHINYNATYPTGNAIQGGRFLYTSSINDIGLITFNRIANNLANTWIKGSKVSTSNTTTTMSLANANVYIGAINWTAFGGASYFCGRQYSLVAIHDGINDAQAAILNTLVQAFQTTLSRQV